MLTDTTCPYCTSNNQANAQNCVMCGSSLISTPLEVLEKQKGLPAGIVLDDGRFQILNEIGRGGFGITYLAFFPEENKHVAIKECFPEDLVSRDLNNQVVPHSGCELEFQTILEDFNHEALILRQLQQLGIPKILWRIAENNTEYIVMEYIHGENLEQRIASKKLLNHFEAVKYLKNLLELLEKLHTNHLLHRDIKPANIVLTKDRAVLLDYGNVFKFTPSQRQKVTSRLLTPEYAPLEQFGENVILSPSTDLYALGATFYEAMTGIKPPTALERANGVSLKSIADLKPRIETTLAKTIEKSLEMRIENRFESAHEMLQALKDDFSDLQKIGVSRINSVQTSLYSTAELKAQVRWSKHKTGLDLRLEYMVLKIPRIAITLFCCIFSVGISIWQRKFGLYGIPVLYLYFWIENVYLVLKSKKYELIDGIVVRSGVTKNPKIHVPYLHYTYVVGEITYGSTRNSFAQVVPDEKLQEKYPTGTVIPVFYDPLHPEQSVITRGFGSYGMNSTFLRLFCLIYALMLGLPFSVYFQAHHNHFFKH